MISSDMENKKIVILSGKATFENDNQLKTPPMTVKKFSLKTAIIIGIYLFSINVHSQVTEITITDSTAVTEKPLKFGCGFGLSFVGGTNIGLSPHLIYAVSNKISLGAGLQGNYTSIKDLQRTTTYGANVIGQYSPIERLTTLLEFAQLKVNTTTENAAGDIKEDYWDSALFVGAGLNITPKISLGAKYNLLYDKDESVYTSPIIPFVNITF